MRTTCVFGAAIAIATLVLLPAAAQETPADAPVEVQDEPEQELQSPEPRHRTRVVGPNAPESRSDQGAAFRVFVREFRFSGNTVVPLDDLKINVAPFEGRELTDADLQSVRGQLLQLYRAAGYPTATVGYPDQDLAGGIVFVEIVEGRLGEVRIAGDHHYDPEFLRRLIGAGEDGPLNAAELEQRLRRLLRDPLLDDVNVRLRPGATPEEVVLEADIVEGRRFGGALRVANDRTPAIGGERWELSGTARNLLGRADRWEVALGGAGGLRDLEVAASVPLDARGTKLFGRFLDYDLQIVEAPLDELDIETEWRSWEVGASSPLFGIRSHDVDLFLAISRQESRSFLQGQPFSFSPGAERGRAAVTALRGGVNWLWRDARQTLSAGATISGGLGAFGATVHDDGRPDSRFVTVRADLQWLRRIGPGQFYARFDAQLSNDPLLPIERAVLGGTYSVRGYRRALLIRDNAWAGSIEYRLPVARLPLPFGDPSPSDGQISLVAFADLGRAWNENEPGDVLNRIWGVGPGIRWDAARGVRAEFYWGGLRRDLDRPGDDVQDKGIHFIVTARQIR